jgi:uncharacterized repeat protein (TIGR01451 family)
MKKLLIILLLFVWLTIPGCNCCQRWNNLWGKEVAPEVAHKCFLSKECKPLAKAAPAKAAPAPAPAKPQPVVKSACGLSSATGAYPCSNCTLVRLEKSMPAEVAMNTEFGYTIKVINPTDIMLNDVVVTENLAGNYKLSDTNPKAKADGTKLTFEIGELGPQQTKVITVSGMATSTDCLKSCATVSYVVPTCTSVNVVQPALKLVKTAPASVLLCEAIPVKFVVTNTGSGSAGNVKIEDTLPEGLKTADGKSTIMIDAGTLAAGQSKQFAATLKADKTGKYENKAVASSSAGLKAEASTVTEVHQPILEITKTGPEKLYTGRPVTYEIMVTNKGDVPAREVILEDQLPTGAKFVSASNGGSALGGKVRWEFETLAPGDSRKVSITVTPDGAGTITNVATAKAVCAEGVSASAKTATTGIAAVLLEVVDVEDPIQVGNTETYVITATNQGSTADTNIKIVCTLEDTEQYVSSSGATNASVAGNTITFAPLPTLAQKAQATWRVTVKGVKAGDVRFTAVMTSDQLTRPVQETEATKIYE